MTKIHRGHITVHSAAAMIIPEDMTRMSLDAPASIEEAAALGYRVIASRTAVPDMV